MADFHQTGVISTFHRLGHTDLERMEKDLVGFSRHRPIALVLPITPVELRSTAAQTIRENLSEIPYLDEIVITLGRATENEDFLKAREFFSSLPQRHRIIWASGPSFSQLYQLLAENDLPVGERREGDGPPGSPTATSWPAKNPRSSPSTTAISSITPGSSSAGWLSRRLAEHQLRLLQGILRPGNGPDARPGDTAVRHASHPQPGEALRLPAPAPFLDSFRYPAGGRVLDADRPRRPQPHPQRLGTRGRDLWPKSTGTIPSGASARPSFAKPTSISTNRSRPRTPRPA